MSQMESDYCNEQAQRMEMLAKDSEDLEVRRHLTRMARNWERRARANNTAQRLQKMCSTSENRSTRFTGRGALTDPHNKQIILGS